MAKLRDYIDLVIAIANFLIEFGKLIIEAIKLVG